MASARQKRNLRQDVTRWPTSVSSYDGFSFQAPLLQKGRWEDQAIQFRTPGGEELTSRAIVYLSCDVEIGDYVALGDYTDTQDPTTIKGAFRVQQFNKIPDLRNVEMERRAYL